MVYEYLLCLLQGQQNSSRRHKTIYLRFSKLPKWSDRRLDCPGAVHWISRLSVLLILWRYSKLNSSFTSRLLKKNNHYLDKAYCLWNWNYTINVFSSNKYSRPFKIFSLCIKKAISNNVTNAMPTNQPTKILALLQKL